MHVYVFYAGWDIYFAFTLAATVLKKSHSLVGKSPFVLNNRLRDMDTLPVTWAQLKTGHSKFKV